MKQKMIAVMMAAVLAATAFVGCKNTQKTEETTAAATTDQATSASTADPPAVEDADTVYRRNNNAEPYLYMNKIGGAMLLSFSDSSDTVKLLKIENGSQTELKSVSYYDHEYLYPLENVLGGKLLIESTRDDYIDLNTGEDIETGKVYSPDGSAFEGFIDGGTRYLYSGTSLYRCDGGDAYTLIATAEAMGVDSIPPMKGNSYFTPDNLYYQRCADGKTTLCRYSVSSKSVTDELTVLDSEDGIDNLIVDGNRAYFSCDNAGTICMADFTTKKVTKLFEGEMTVFNTLGGRIYAGVWSDEESENGVFVIDPDTGSSEKILSGFSPDGLYFFDDQTLYAYGYRGDNAMFIGIDLATRNCETVYAIG